MRKSAILFMLFLPVFCFGQVNENFMDGNFTSQPVWTGAVGNFYVNTAGQLQSKALTASTSTLFTASEAMDDASWECWVKINYNPSSGNYSCIYIVSDVNDVSEGCNGYFVKIGDTQDDVSLWLQEGTKKTKIIDGKDKRTDLSPCELKIKVTRDAQGNFSLYSKAPTEPDYVMEGSVQNTVAGNSRYFGLMYVNTSTTGSAYYFDDIVVTGKKAPDLTPPSWTTLTLEIPNRLHLGFSEPMNFASATYSIDGDMGVPSSQTIATDLKSVLLQYEGSFKQGVLYHLRVSGLTDLAGNVLTDTLRPIGIYQRPDLHDLILNEVMFEQPDSSAEYIEIYNVSEKLLDVSGVKFTTRKTDGTLNTGNSLPVSTYLLPDTYLALTGDAGKVRKYHHCRPEANIITTDWTTLNNESATLVLCNATKDSIFDELLYSVKWHHPLIKNPKGVALERIHPLLPTQLSTSWHSASSDTNYGTPGSKNSQYRSIDGGSETLKTVWCEPEAFSPDNDGVNDVCFIHYRTESNGYVANVQILSPSGLKVYQLASNILLSNEGFLTWDGKTDRMKNANPGVYVLYFEMFNPENGGRMVQKLPIVVSSR